MVTTLHRLADFLSNPWRLSLVVVALISLVCLVAGVATEFAQIAGRVSALAFGLETIRYLGTRQAMKRRASKRESTGGHGRSRSRRR